MLSSSLILLSSSSSSPLIPALHSSTHALYVSARHTRLTFGICVHGRALRYTQSNRAQAGLSESSSFLPSSLSPSQPHDLTFKSHSYTALLGFDFREQQVSVAVEVSAMFN
ncbi:unnamed protein product [Prorocentrum cordatum]|uniref:Uncharacterized protein n=1 Tax=Prorocentrum cordatum TaxID=2364126 RepID=A0ABN9UY87_9DINO|nr:unnamed protein product [Polarella glacialis]